VGAIRYNIIRIQAEKKIVFKWEDALNFEGDSAPFIQYAHARACSILRNSQHRSDDYSPDLSKVQLNLINEPSEIELIRILGKFPGLVRKSAKERQCHMLASYAREVGAAFNQFYRDCPVLKAESSDLIESRLTIVAATRNVLRNVMDLLGIIRAT
jgi:arginyl-tRNA synthetase